MAYYNDNQTQTAKSSPTFGSMIDFYYFCRIKKVIGSLVL